MVLDNGLDNIEHIIVRGAGVRDSTILEEKVLRLISLRDEESHVTPIINNRIRSVTLTIILVLYQGIRDASLLLLNNITFPGGTSSRFIMCNDIHSVLLGRENVARAPTEVSTEGLESLNQHCRLDGHVERFRNKGATRHLKYLSC